MASKMFMVGLNLDWLEPGGGFSQELFATIQCRGVGVRGTGRNLSLQCSVISR